jgi:hypothetical protein
MCKNAVPAHATKGPWGVQDGVHLLVAPHGPHGTISSLPDLKWKYVLEGAEKGFAHVGQARHIVLIGLWLAVQVIPAQPLIDSQVNSRKWIGRWSSTTSNVVS